MNIFKRLIPVLFLFSTVQIKSQSNQTDSAKYFSSLIRQLDDCKTDSEKLDKLFEIHYYQQALIGELNETNIRGFNTKYTKQAIFLARDLKKFDTLKSLTLDLGYIFDLNKNFDSSFVYYSECLNVFEASKKFQLTYFIAQNILYNNSMLQSIIEEDNRKAVEQKDKINKLTYVTIAALGLFLALLFFYFRKSKQKNELLVKQKNKIEKSKKEIDSSIDYAQNIQNAILSNENKIKKYVSDSFVLFMPRDKVSGDFLWSYKSGNDIYVAIADCTGHGVPGALLSIVGYLLLDNILATNPNQSPSQILNSLHKAVVNSLNQEVLDHNHNNDGMDLGLIKLNLESNKLIFSGANRSLYHVSNNNVNTLKATRRPIGGTQIDYKNNFLDIELQLQRGDCIYCFSDGYQDQTGGTRGKKMMIKRLSEFLKVNAGNSMGEQKELLINNFVSYKNDHLQVDDVLIVGIKI